MSDSGSRSMSASGSTPGVLRAAGACTRLPATRSLIDMTPTRQPTNSQPQTRMARANHGFAITGTTVRGQRPSSLGEQFGELGKDGSFRRAS